MLFRDILYLLVLPVSRRINRYAYMSALELPRSGCRRPRHRIVPRYNVVRSTLINQDITTPLQVGNGNFAFNVDSTGMQVAKSSDYSKVGCTS